MNIKNLVNKKSVASIDSIKGKKILLRIDVNVSLGENITVDPGEDWRILKSLDTINFLREGGAQIILMAHIGRNKKDSLKPVFEYMKQFFTLGFIPKFDSDLIKNTLDGMQNGSVVMLENVRQNEGEKINDDNFLTDIIKECDYYVNDAFSVSHREHASIMSAPQHLPSYFGLQFIDEVNHMLSFLENKGGMKVLILGGAKFGTKLPLLEKLLPKLDYVLMGGALANVFLKARGFAIGKSFCDTVDVSLVSQSDKIILPIDYVDQYGDVADIHDVRAEDMILDIGPGTNELFDKIIDHASSLMWNGPMGKYEDNYIEGSLRIADSIAKSYVTSITGGGDTSTVILENGLENDFDFISTGGGAMLDFLLHGTLPGIEVILNQKIH